MVSPVPAASLHSWELILPGDPSPLPACLLRLVFKGSRCCFCIMFFISANPSALQGKKVSLLSCPCKMGKRYAQGHLSWLGTGSACYTTPPSTSTDFKASRNFTPLYIFLKSLAKICHQLKILLEFVVDLVALEK